MKNFPGIIFKIFLIFLAVGSLATIYMWHEDGLRFYSVQADSMIPALRVGNLVIDEKAQFSSLKPGDVVSFVSPVDQRVIITHRIVKTDSQKLLITTRGDNIVSPDTPVVYSEVIGRTVATAPYAGYLL